MEFERSTVLAWRLAGAAVWQAGVTAVAYMLVQLALSPLQLLSPLRLALSALAPSAWFAIATLVAVQAPAFLACAATMTTYEPGAKSLLALTGVPAQVGAAVAKAAARAGSLPALAAQAAYFAAHAACAVPFLFYVSNRFFSRVGEPRATRRHPPFRMRPAPDAPPPPIHPATPQRWARPPGTAAGWPWSTKRIPSTGAQTSWPSPPSSATAISASSSAPPPRPPAPPRWPPPRRSRARRPPPWRAATPSPPAPPCCSSPPPRSAPSSG
jgi:hypothetical protein